MVYIPVEITSEGQELLFGNTDSRHNLYKAIYDVLKKQHFHNAAACLYGKNQRIYGKPGQQQ